MRNRSIGESSSVADRAYSNRVLILITFGFLLIFCVLARLMYLQIFNHQEYSTRSENNRIQIRSIAPPRGQIFDRNGTLLATNRRVLSLALIPERIQDLDTTIALLREQMDVSDQEVQLFEQRAKGRARHDAVVLKRDISSKDQAFLALNRHRFVGVDVTTETIRHYVYGETFVHALGSVRRITIDDLRDLDSVAYRGTQFVGGTGVERFYESSLHGVVGSRSVEVDATGRVLHEIEEQRIPPLQGAALTLHLDYKTQLAADEALGEWRGAVVAIEPKTGGILAMVSKPTYDPNRKLLGVSSDELDEIYSRSDAPEFNRAIQGEYAPGSTFKPVVGMAALQQELIEWDEVLIDTGTFRLPNSSMVYRSWNRTKTHPGGHGKVDMHRAIYRSANVYFYTLASQLDVDLLARFAREQFGVGKVTSFDLPEAVPGVMPTRHWKQNAVGEPWYPGDSVILGIGQGFIAVSPLQLATIATTFANRGAWIVPRMFKASEQPLPEVEDLPISMQRPDEGDAMLLSWEKMAHAMSDVVHRGYKGYDQNGTAWAYIGMDAPFVMAGKSGTAQVFTQDRDIDYEEEELAEQMRNHALFIAYAPLEHPQIAVAVVVEHGGSGSRVAAPIARAVLDAYLVKPQVATRG